jgi:hypothetical protein
VRETVSQDPSLSHRQIVEHLCTIAHRVVLAFDTARNAHIEQRQFADLDEKDQVAVRNRVHLALRFLHHDPAEIWQAELEKLEDAGWTRGFSLDNERMQSPLIRPYDELPVMDRQRFAVFVEVVHAIYQ